MKMVPELLDAKTAAKLLCLRRDQFLNLVEQQVLPPAKRIGPLLRWRRDELMNWLRSTHTEQGMEWP